MSTKLEEIIVDADLLDNLGPRVAIVPRQEDAVDGEKLDGLVALLLGGADLVLRDPL